MKTLNDAFRKLKTDSGLTTAQFAKRAKVQQPNISAYTSGASSIGPKALLRACENYFSWPVMPLMEIAPFTGAFATLPTVGGIYVLYDSAGNVVYFGKATNFRAEVAQTWKRTSSFPTRFGPDLKKEKHMFGAVTSFLSLYQIDTPRVRKNFEAFLLRIFPNQTHNHNLGKFS